MVIYAFGDRVPKIHPTAWVFPSADIIGKVTIGPYVYVGAGAVIRGDYGEITIGEGSAVEENVTIHARPGGLTTIEENVTIGHAAMIHNCTLKKGSIIGMKSTVTDFAEVGEGAIIAEGAVVKTKSKIGAYMVAVGIPAKEKGPVRPELTELWGGFKANYRRLCEQYKTYLRVVTPEEYSLEN